MSAFPPVPPLQAPLPTEPTQIDAFQSALNAASAALSANPQAIGQGLLSGIDDFNARETQFRTAVAHAEANGSSQAAPGALSDPSNPAAPSRLTMAQAMREGDALQDRSLALMMQTYSFALEATLVSNAATTFTSSVNTLIKTQ